MYLHMYTRERERETDRETHTHKGGPGPLREELAGHRLHAELRQVQGLSAYYVYNHTTKNSVIVSRVWYQ